MFDSMTIGAGFDASMKFSGFLLLFFSSYWMEEKERNWRSHEEEVKHNQLLLNKNRWFVLCVEFLVLAFSLFAFAAMMLLLCCRSTSSGQSNIKWIQLSEFPGEYSLNVWVHYVTVEWVFVWFELIISSPLVLESWHVLRHNNLSNERKSLKLEIENLTHKLFSECLLGHARSASINHLVPSKYVCVINQTFKDSISLHHRIIKKLSQRRSPIWMKC